MKLDEMTRRILELRADGKSMTLLAVCPNSDAVLEAAIKTAQCSNSPMLFAATLNQVDRDGGYTGMTPASFVARMNELRSVYDCTVPLIPCLDHGGPWLRDSHTRDHLSLADTMAQVKKSLEACLDARYALLHIDPTVDRTLGQGGVLQIDAVIERTVELIAHAERYRVSRGLSPVSYEVGTEEVHGGLADRSTFARFLSGLRMGLAEVQLSDVWPSFIVAKVGTDLHTTTFDADLASSLAAEVSDLGSLVKGHYTDWVANPADYPRSGMGGANVGPEFTVTELAALEQLCQREQVQIGQVGHVTSGSGFKQALKLAVVSSKRWRKWLTDEEKRKDFDALDPHRQEWLVATGARYVWTDPVVLSARKALYGNLHTDEFDPQVFVIDEIGKNIQKYLDAFNLRGATDLLRG